MKPDWSKAPDWANYVAMDSNGEWYWHKLKPVAFEGPDDWGSKYWKSDNDQIQSCDDADPYKWEETLEKRP